MNAEPRPRPQAPESGRPIVGLRQLVGAVVFITTAVLSISWPANGMGSASSVPPRVAGVSDLILADQQNIACAVVQGQQARSGLADGVICFIHEPGRLTSVRVGSYIGYLFGAGPKQGSNGFLPENGAEAKGLYTRTHASHVLHESTAVVRVAGTDIALQYVKTTVEGKPRQGEVVLELDSHGRPKVSARTHSAYAMFFSATVLEAWELKGGKVSILFSHRQGG